MPATFLNIAFCLSLLWAQPLLMAAESASASVIAPQTTSPTPEAFSPEFQKTLQSERLLDEAVSKGQITVNSYRGEKIYDLLNHPFFLEMQQEALQTQTDIEFDVGIGTTTYHTNEMGPFLGWEPLSPTASLKMRYRLFGQTLLVGSLGQALKVNASERLGLGIASQVLGDVLVQQPLFSGGDIKASFFRLSAGLSGFSFPQTIPAHSYFLQNYWALQFGFGRVFILTNQLAIGLEAFVRTALVRTNSYQNASEPKDGQGFQFINSIVYRPSRDKALAAEERRNISYSLDLLYRAENFSVSTNAATLMGASRLFLEQMMVAFTFKFLQ